MFNLSFLEKIHSRHGCQQYHKIILQSWNHGVEKSKKEIFPQRSFTISAHLVCRQTCKIVEETIASLVLEQVMTLTHTKAIHSTLGRSYIYHEKKKQNNGIHDLSHRSIVIGTKYV